MVQETGPAAGGLAAAWPEVSARLTRYLRKHNLPLADVEDIVQTVAERAVAKAVPFNTSDQLLHWCITVAKNLEIDRYRSLARRNERALEEEGGPTAVPWLLEDAVLSRLRLVRTLEALKSMRHRDKALIVDAVQGAHPASGKERVARHRARQRLLELVGPPSLAVAFARRLWRPAAPSALPAALASAAVLAVFALGPVVLRLPNAQAIPSVAPAAEAIPNLPIKPPSPVAAVRTSPMDRHPDATPPETSSLQSPSNTQTDVIDPSGMARLSGHERREQDTGLVCIDDFPLLNHACFGPKTIQPEEVPAPEALRRGVEPTQSTQATPPSVP